MGHGFGIDGLGKKRLMTRGSRRKLSKACNVTDNGALRRITSEWSRSF